MSLSLVPQGSEGGFESPGTKDTGGCELPCGAGDQLWVLCQEQVLLAVLDLTL